MSYAIFFAMFAFQIWMAVHAYNTGRERWIFYILIAPFMGALLYLLLHWVPDIERRFQQPASYYPESQRQARRSDESPSSWSEIVDPVTHSLPDPTQRLQKLKEMLEQELITEAEYEAKKAEILEDL